MPRSFQATPEIDFATLQQAAEWFAVLQADDVAENDRRHWQQWLASSGAHRQAWLRVEAVSQRLGVVTTQPAHAEVAAEALQGPMRVDRRRRQALKTLAVLGGTGIVGWGTMQQSSWPAPLLRWTADRKTTIGDIQSHPLADGSQLWLDTGSAVDVAMSNTQRHIVVKTGAALIDTADAATSRRLSVETVHGRADTQGARLYVRQTAKAAEVAVFSGSVEVYPAASGTPLHLAAGMQTRLERGHVETPQPADPAREAWTRGLLLAEHQRLDAFVAELGRYRPGYLACAPGVAELRVVGAFPLRDTDQALAMLAHALPVKIRAPMPWWVTVEAA